MADIKKIKIGNTTYDIRDATAARSNHTHAYTPVSVLPADNGEIKTKYRIAQKGDAGRTAGTYRYYKICNLPTNDSGNYASAIISGRIGGWTSSDMSYINALIWNRGTPGISLIDIAGSATSMASIWNTCDLVLYKNGAGSAADEAVTATLYAKCYSWFSFDLDLEVFQQTASITYDGTYTTTTPSGTLVVQASTSKKRLELMNSELYVDGTKMSKNGHTHDLSIATSTGTSGLTLAHGSKYALTAGGKSFIFTMPSDNNTHNSHAIISGTKADNSTQIKGSESSGDITLGDSGVTAGTYRSVTVNSKGIVVAGSSADTDTNTWRKVQLDGADKLGTETSTKPLNIKAGSNMNITESNGTFTFAATDTTYTFNGAVSTIKDSNLTASRALISNSSGKIAVSDVTSTELSYLDGVTSNVQTQLNAKASDSAVVHKSGDTMTGDLTLDISSDQSSYKIKLGSNGSEMYAASSNELYINTAKLVSQGNYDRGYYKFPYGDGSTESSRHTIATQEWVRDNAVDTDVIATKTWTQNEIAAASMSADVVNTTLVIGGYSTYNLSENADNIY